MNKAILFIFAALAVIVLVESKESRRKVIIRTLCETQSCAHQCQTSGYESGHCKAGDMIMFCNCGDCVADLCETSCAKDKMNSTCESAENGKCVCDDA